MTKNNLTQFFGSWSVVRGPWFASEKMIRTTKHEERGTNKGVALIGTLLVIIVVSVFLAAYATWVIYDQRNLMRQQILEKADALALAGLARAKQDLFLDSGSWLDGNISGNIVNQPNQTNATAYYRLYGNEIFLGEGSYITEIQYQSQPKNQTSCTYPSCKFYDKIMRVRSTGYIPNATQARENRTLQEIVNLNLIMNLGTRTHYFRIDRAVNESNYATYHNETIAITDVVLDVDENLTLDNDEDIRGCYDSNFNYRNCMDYRTNIKGSVIISGNANVSMGGMTIE